MTGLSTWSSLAAMHLSAPSLHAPLQLEGLLAALMAVALRAAAQQQEEDRQEEETDRRAWEAARLAAAQTCAVLVNKLHHAAALSALALLQVCQCVFVCRCPLRPCTEVSIFFYERGNLSCTCMQFSNAMFDSHTPIPTPGALSSVDPISSPTNQKSLRQPEGSPVAPPAAAAYLRLLCCSPASL